MVPSGWKIKKLKDLSDGKLPAVKAGPFGSSLKKEFYVEAGYKIYGQEQVISGDAFYGSYYIDRQRYESLKSCAVKAGDILISLVGTVGRVLLLPQNCESGVINPRLLRLSLSKDKAFGLFFKYFLEASHTSHTLLSWAQGGTMGVLNAEMIKNLSVPLPPLPEQKKIAEILSTWDKTITTTEQLLANSQQQKKALMQQLLTGKKRLHDQTGQPFTGEWVTKKLGEIGEIKSAGVDKKIIEGETPVRLLNFTDVFRKDFVFSNELEHWVTAPETKIRNCDVRKGDVFFTPSSETRDEIGIPSVAAEDIPECCYSYHIIRFRINEKWDLNFKAYAFSTDDFRRQAYKLGDGSGQRYVISQDGFRGIEVTYPEYKEQVAIGKVLKSSEDTIQALKQKLDHLKQEKKALMQQLLTGKRRVKVEAA